MLKLGIIGLSEGNGHPYSWSAIINGHSDQRAIEETDYALIAAYCQAHRQRMLCQMWGSRMRAATGTLAR